MELFEMVLAYVEKFWGGLRIIHGFECDKRAIIGKMLNFYTVVLERLFQLEQL